MTLQSATLTKLQMLETLYRRGYRSQVIDRAVDKLIVLEQARTHRELADLEARLQAFEVRYAMASAEFYARYEAGQLDDSADFMEWSSFYDMRTAAQQRLHWLSGQA